MTLNHIHIACMKYEYYTKFCEDAHNVSIHITKNTNLGISVELVFLSLQYAFGLHSISNDTISFHAFNSPGHPLNISSPEGDWDGGIIQAMKEGTVDIAVPTFEVSSLRFTSIDYTLPASTYEQETFLVHIGNNDDQMPPKLLEIFTLKLWVLGTTILILLGFSIQFFAEYQSKRKTDQKQSIHTLLCYFDRNKIMHKTVNLFDVIFGISFEKRSKSRWLKIRPLFLVTIWSLCSILGISLFKTFYVMSLTPKLTKIPFKSAAELGKCLKRQEYKLIVGEFGFWNDRMDPNSKFGPWRYLRETVPYNTPIYVQNLTAAIEILLATPNTVLPSFVLVSVVDESNNALSLDTFAVRKGLPYLEQFVLGNLLIKQFGLEVEVHKKYGLIKNPATVIKSHKDLKPLDMKKLFRAFRILVIGLISSAVLLIIEIICLNKCPHL